MSLIEKKKTERNRDNFWSLVIFGLQPCDKPAMLVVNAI